MFVDPPLSLVISFKVQVHDSGMHQTLLHSPRYKASGLPELHYDFCALANSRRCGLKHKPTHNVTWIEHGLKHKPMHNAKFLTMHPNVATRYLSPIDSMDDTFKFENLNIYI